MDGEALFHGLEEAMARCDDLVFVSTGGPVAGHEAEPHASFWSAARSSRFAARFRDLGRLPRQQALEALVASHVVVCLSRPSLEAELGSRQRVVEAIAHGRPAVATDLGDLARAIGKAGAGILVPPGEAQPLAEALLTFARERERLQAAAVAARRLWAERFAYEATWAPLARWAVAPSRWPPSVLAADGVARLQSERQRLQADLDEIRGSYTFRTLRLVDRLLGRGR
jgi:glycosyltransferase involved in cell wall biosynthesis